MIETRQIFIVVRNSDAAANEVSMPTVSRADVVYRAFPNDKVTIENSMTDYKVFGPYADFIEIEKLDLAIKDINKVLHRFT